MPDKNIMLNFEKQRNKYRVPRILNCRFLQNLRMATMVWTRHGCGVVIKRKLKSQVFNRRQAPESSTRDSWVLKTHWPCYSEIICNCGLLLSAPHTVSSVFASFFLPTLLSSVSGQRSGPHLSVRQKKKNMPWPPVNLDCTWNAGSNPANTKETSHLQHWMSVFLQL